MALTFTAGQRITAAALNAIIPQIVIKPSNESVTSSTTMQNDNDLVLPVLASATYEFQCQLFFTAASGGDLKWEWGVPSGASLLYQPLHNEGGGTGLNNSTQANADSNVVPAAGGGSTVEAVLMTGTLVMAATAGNLQLKWAQNTSNGTATIMRIGSYLTLQRVS